MDPICSALGRRSYGTGVQQVLDYHASTCPAADELDDLLSSLAPTGTCNPWRQPQQHQQQHQQQQMPYVPQVSGTMYTGSVACEVSSNAICWASYSGSGSSSSSVSDHTSVSDGRLTRA